MRSTISLFLLSTLGSLALACSGGGECEQAFEKELECTENADERKEAEGFRKMAIAACNAAKDDPTMKAAIKCSKKKSCDEFRSCQAQARAGDDVKELEAYIAEGNPVEAMRNCSYDLDAYTAVPEVKAVCDKAFTAVFADLSKEETRDDARYTCTSSDAGKWLAASAALKTGCTSLLTDLETRVTKQRDDGSEYDYGTCSSYKELVKALTPDNEAAGEMLCNEADQAEAFGKAVAAAKKNLAEKKADVPFECGSFLGEKDDFKGSDWYATKSKDLAKVCYGELGKTVLSSMSGWCPSDAKDTHKYAAEFALAEGDEEFTKLLAKTAGECSK